MPRTITIDNVQIIQMQFAKDSTGEVHVHCEFHLKSGNQFVQAKFLDITQRLGATRRSAVLSLFDAVAQDVASSELA